MTFRRATQFGMAGGVLLSAYAYLSLRMDDAQLRDAAAQCVGTKSSAAEKTLALLKWVHDIPQTAENHRFFLLPRLRATPLQVLESGGDCADKSRLLTAMLRQVGVNSTMVLLFDPRSGRSTHTVVCSRLEDGSSMVVDPAYGLYFSDRASGRFLGLTELRRDPSLLTERLRELREQVGRRDPIQVYDADAAGYSLASSFNWNKNFLTRAVRDLLLPSWGDDLYMIPRPRVLEEPQLFVACLGLALSAGLGALQWITTRVRRLSAPRRTPRPILAASTPVAWGEAAT